VHGKRQLLNWPLPPAAQLPYTVSWQDLKDFFKENGFDPLRADIIDNGEGYSKGCGTVLLATPEDAQAAIDKLDGFDFQGRPVQLKLVRAICGTLAFEAGLISGIVQRAWAMYLSFVGMPLGLFGASWLATRAGIPFQRRFASLSFSLFGLIHTWMDHRIMPHGCIIVMNWHSLLTALCNLQRCASAGQVCGPARARRRRRRGPRRARGPRRVSRGPRPRRNELTVPTLTELPNGRDPVLTRGPRQVIQPIVGIGANKS
jgi:hypothetical protein